ncbi:MAG: hypothetical protein J6M63_02975 [Pseudobutyrivibrio sp.]|uniref:Uncharacterized protein n=1 Tax=Pseudobutyrivibrio ruminis TaxID=46206 RepID=A0A927YRA4_9FIRM|nr:hypothetical protein [Pseudobutyrivibrio ruminis]MBO6282876.1 hypothetical protein [Pseudobutyrivibrio sp.]MBP3261323.1 hypothetical protein [Pseudobutyrivibrio sp.]MBQ8488469.1 hypothetical protein [Pseudobutyrivibrio sp.]
MVRHVRHLPSIVTSTLWSTL